MRKSAVLRAGLQMMPLGVRDCRFCTAEEILPRACSTTSPRRTRRHSARAGLAQVVAQVWRKLSLCIHNMIRRLIGFACPSNQPLVLKHGQIALQRAAGDGRQLNL
jgi:hypothetical protein